MGRPGPQGGSAWVTPALSRKTCTSPVLFFCLSSPFTTCTSPPGLLHLFVFSFALVFLCCSSLLSGPRSRLGSGDQAPPPLHSRGPRPQPLERSVRNHSGKRLLLAMGTEKGREMKGLCNRAAARLTGSLTRVPLR